MPHLHQEILSICSQPMQMLLVFVQMLWTLLYNVPCAKIVRDIENTLCRVWRVIYWLWHSIDFWRVASGFLFYLVHYDKRIIVNWPKFIEVHNNDETFCFLFFALVLSVLFNMFQFYASIQSKNAPHQPVHKPANKSAAMQIAELFPKY
jgi:hypothetical protein